MSSGTVVAVVVTHQRLELLATSLDAIAQQSRRPDHVVVVDNGVDQPAADVVAACGLPVTYLLSRRNLGGAGGFALGMLHALSLGADWVWCADDDGRPGDAHVLEELIRVAEQHDLAEVSPLVADLQDPDRLAFPLRRGLRWRRSRSDFADQPLIEGYASLFNGALFRAQALETVGVPDLRLFFRGDETEIHRRLRRSGLAFGTATTVTYLHPEGTSEFEPILGGRLSAQYPSNAVKRYYTYRNRGYLMGQRGLRWLLPLEVVRFTWFFAVTRRDLPGLREWLRLTRQGRREHMRRP